MLCSQSLDCTDDALDVGNTAINKAVSIVFAIHDDVERIAWHVFIPADVNQRPVW